MWSVWAYDVECLAYDVTYRMYVCVWHTMWSVWAYDEWCVLAYDVVCFGHTMWSVWTYDVVCFGIRCGVFAVCFGIRCGVFGVFGHMYVRL